MRRVVLTVLLLAVRGVSADDFVGPGACAARPCHGSATARSGPVEGDEYVVWSTRDRHAGAYRALASERGLRMARLLGMADEHDTAPGWIGRTAAPEQCLSCHAVPGGARAEEGVSCEACHGAARAWLTSHVHGGDTPGLVATGDPLAAASTCLGCHLGDERRRVDHRMYAAGHPPLTFELDTFASNLPPHWQTRERNAGWANGGAWIAGQAAQARAAARQASALAPGAWPEFSVYDCYACHHPLGEERSAIGGGEPSWDASRWIGIVRIAQVLDPARARDLERGLAQLAALVAGGQTGDEVRRTAAEAEALLDDMVRARAGWHVDAARLRRALADPALAGSGFRVAQQAAWGLDALGATPDLDALFADLRDPLRYDPGRVARRLRDVRANLP